ncbi:hypothetical protein VIGAN_02131800 [Vigna angularis var. angularis]|uniref:Uncharacterized protein n=1 Tax=Vigna angularis var. angularis TaxID=157739 RepID=A0A0S3RDK4_PHAAN|nr:hypothetical protein VIGAN_02131800 [Vigna angularis var. angularis]
MVEYIILQKFRSTDYAESLCELSRIARPCRGCSLSGKFVVRAVRCANYQRVMLSVYGLAMANPVAMRLMVVWDHCPFNSKGEWGA